ncbi:Major facilitator superfamily MFS_1 [Candidatus Sulfopaludibacter sp. SbA3]|nr:Major facilitator superfamily MFS_1 [Candidatus Sulfopaludibacter sp. SbA3]
MTVSKEERAYALRFIVCLGVVSLFADMTYEGAYSIIGPFLKDLGASATQVGLIAGLGEMIAASLRYFSGKLVDRTRAYWTIAILGYVLNLVVVPAMAFAGNWQMAALLVVIERTGKSLRGPARDVLLSEATSKIGHGWGFGVHAAMDQTGAVLGPLLMVVAVARTQHFGPAFLRLAIPAAAALAALLVARAVYPNAGATTPRPAKQKTLPKVFWMYIAAAGVLACGFVDFPLLAYHFQKMALAQPAVIPLLYAGAMGVNGLTALIFGKLFDRYGIVILSFGILVSLFALPLGFLGGPAGAVASVACWATGLGVQDASLRSGIAQVVSMNKRGTAFGAFNGVYGVAWFLGSAVMGLLYDHSLAALVIFGMVAQAVAAVMFFRLRAPLAEARQ